MWQLWSEVTVLRINRSALRCGKTPIGLFALRHPWIKIRWELIAPISLYHNQLFLPPLFMTPMWKIIAFNTLPPPVFWAFPVHFQWLKILPLTHYHHQCFYLILYIFKDDNFRLYRFATAVFVARFEKKVRLILSPSLNIFDLNKNLIITL